MGMRVNSILAIFIILGSFTYAGTIDVGIRIFPAEVFLLCFLLLFPSYWLVNLVSLSRLEVAALGLALIFLFNSTLSLFFLDSRVNMLGSYKELSRLAICILTFSVILGWCNRNSLNKYWAQFAFVTSSTLVSLYAIYQSFLVRLTGSYIALLPGSSEVPNQNGRAVGTFYEGGYMALYVGAAIILLSTYKRMYRPSHYKFLLGINALALALTQSTAGIICMLISLIYMYYRLRFSLRSMVGAVVAVIILIFSYSIFKQKLDAVGRFVSTMDYGLLQGGLGSLSAADRITKIIKGCNMFFDNPIFGVGIGQYSWLYNIYSPPSLSDDLGSVVPLNVFIQILSENGIVGFGILSVFIFVIWMNTQRHGRAMLLYILLSMNFYPTYKYVFIWILFALVLRAGKEGHLADIAKAA